MLLHLPLVAHRELPATLGSPTRQHFPTVLRGHPGTKAVCVLALSLVGLKCPFHTFHAPTLVTLILPDCRPQKRGLPAQGNPLRSFSPNTAQIQHKKTMPDIQPQHSKIENIPLAFLTSPSYHIPVRMQSPVLISCE